jgi:hypothetical protein
MPFARCSLVMSDSYKKNALYLYILYTSLLFAAISIFAINWDKSLNFCSQHTYSLKTPKACAITGQQVDCTWFEHVVDDVDDMLLSSGQYVTWVSVFGYNCLVVALITSIFGYAQREIPAHRTDYFLYVLLVEVLLYSSWAVYGMTISFSSRFPEECAHYKLGNNLMWIIVRFFSAYNFVLVPLMLYNLVWLWKQHSVQDVQCAVYDMQSAENQACTQIELFAKTNIPNTSDRTCRAETKL